MQARACVFDTVRRDVPGRTWRPSGGTGDRRRRLADVAGFGGVFVGTAMTSARRHRPIGYGRFGVGAAFSSAAAARVHHSRLSPRGIQADRIRIGFGLFSSPRAPRRRAGGRQRDARPATATMRFSQAEPGRASPGRRHRGFRLRTIGAATQPTCARRLLQAIVTVTSYGGELRPGQSGRPGQLTREACAPARADYRRTVLADVHALVGRNSAGMVISIGARRAPAP